VLNRKKVVRLFKEEFSNMYIEMKFLLFSRCGAGVGGGDHIIFYTLNVILLCSIINPISLGGDLLLQTMERLSITDANVKRYVIRCCIM
jgi:hypothetical protein